MSDASSLAVETSTKNRMSDDKDTSLILPDNLPGLSAWKKRRHLLDTKDLTVEEVETLIAVAKLCKDIHSKGRAPLTVLSHKVVANLFYENSTRTRSSFELGRSQIRRLGPQSGHSHVFGRQRRDYRRHCANTRFDGRRCCCSAPQLLRQRAQIGGIAPG